MSYCKSMARLNVPKPGHALTYGTAWPGLVTALARLYRSPYRTVYYYVLRYLCFTRS